MRRGGGPLSRTRLGVSQLLGANTPNHFTKRAPHTPEAVALDPAKEAWASSGPWHCLSATIYLFGPISVPDSSSCPTQRSVDAPDALAKCVPTPRPQEGGVGR